MNFFFTEEEGKEQSPWWRDRSLGQRPMSSGLSSSDEAQLPNLESMPLALSADSWLGGASQLGGVRLRYAGNAKSSGREENPPRRFPPHAKRTKLHAGSLFFFSPTKRNKKDNPFHFYTWNVRFKINNRKTKISNSILFF